MRVGGEPHRAIRAAADGVGVEIVDQTLLPFEFALRRLETLEDAAEAIRAMRVRGAPLIGVTAAYAMALAGNQVRTARMATFLTRLEKVASELAAARRALAAHLLAPTLGSSSVRFSSSLSLSLEMR